MTSPQGTTGPRPNVYVILRVIGCRIHYLSITGGWSPTLNHWCKNWLSSEREEAYQAAQRAGGLLVRMTQAEWAASLDGAVAQQSPNEEPQDTALTRAAKEFVADHP